MAARAARGIPRTCRSRSRSPVTTSSRTRAQRGRARGRGLRRRHRQPAGARRRVGPRGRRAAAASCSGFTARSRWCWRRRSRCASASNGARTARPSTRTRRSAARTGCSPRWATCPACTPCRGCLPGGADLEQFLRRLDGRGERIVAERARETGASAASDGRLPRAPADVGPSGAAVGARSGIAGDGRPQAGAGARQPLSPGHAGQRRRRARSQAQYDANGLTPADGSQVPTVPEPGTWALIALLALALLVARRARTRRAGACGCVACEPVTASVRPRSATAGRGSAARGRCALARSPPPPRAGRCGAGTPRASATRATTRWASRALLALFALSAGRRDAAPAPPRRWETLPATLALLAYAASFPFVPPLASALLAFAALGFSWSLWRHGTPFRPWTLGLALLGLPMAASLQFYLGYPMRVASGAVALVLLRLSGIPVVREGVYLRWGGELVMIDAPCSGIRMLWAGAAARLLPGRAVPHARARVAARGRRGRACWRCSATRCARRRCSGRTPPRSPASRCRAAAHEGIGIVAFAAARGRADRDRAPPRQARKEGSRHAPRHRAPAGRVRRCAATACRWRPFARAVARRALADRAPRCTDAPPSRCAWPTRFEGRALTPAAARRARSTFRARLPRPGRPLPRRPARADPAPRRAPDAPPAPGVRLPARGRVRDRAAARAPRPRRHHLGLLRRHARRRRRRRTPHRVRADPRRRRPHLARRVQLVLARAGRRHHRPLVEHDHGRSQPRAEPTRPTPPPVLKARTIPGQNAATASAAGVAGLPPVCPARTCPGWSASAGGRSSARSPPSSSSTR